MRELNEYFRPGTPREAVDIKREYGQAARYLAGGSDLMVDRPAGVRAAIDIRHAGMGEIVTDGEYHCIGGAALLRDVERALPDVAGGMLRAAVRDTAPWLIRNAATLAGNLANASPAADSVPALLALDAELALMDGDDTVVAASDVLLGPHRTKLGDRLIRFIRIPAAAGRKRGAFIKHARSKSDIAQVNVAVAARLEGETLREVRIALGAVAPTAMRAVETESLLEGRIPDERALAEAQRVAAAEVRPISDWRASADYRRLLSGVLVRRALERIIVLPGNGEGE